MKTREFIDNFIKVALTSQIKLLMHKTSLADRLQALNTCNVLKEKGSKQSWIEGTERILRVLVGSGAQMQDVLPKLAESEIVYQILNLLKEIVTHETKVRFFAIILRVMKSCEPEIAIILLW